MAQEPIRRKAIRPQRDRVSSESLSAAIGRLRSMSAMSQEDLAQTLGTKQPNVAAWESGRRVPTIRTLERLADEFGVDISIKPGQRVVVSPSERRDDRNK